MDKKCKSEMKKAPAKKGKATKKKPYRSPKKWKE